MEFADFLTQLNLMLGDTSNFALSIDQKTQNLQTAFKDQYVVSEVWDNTLIFSISAYEYTLPADIDVVSDIYLTRDQDRFPEPIDTSLWEQVDGSIHFLPNAQWKIPDQYSLWLKGIHKNLAGDTITDDAVQNYILSLAGYICLRNVSYTKLLSFLRNDSTIPDILNMRKEMQNDMQMYRAQLATRFISS